MKRILSIKIILCLFLLALTNNKTYSQKGYEPGFIITNQNDTLFGSIRDRVISNFNSKIYPKIKFKKKGKRRHKKYSPNMINGYTVSNRNYVSLNVEAESVFFKTTYTINNSQKKNRFVRRVRNGYLSYYHMEYIDEDNDTIEFEDFFKKQNSNKLVRVTQGVFGLKRKKLIAYFSDCPELQSKLKNKEVKTPMEVMNYYNNWISHNSK